MATHGHLKHFTHHLQFTSPESFSLGMSEGCLVTNGNVLGDNFCLPATLSATSSTPTQGHLSLTCVSTPLKTQQNPQDHTAACQLGVS